LEQRNVKQRKEKKKQEHNISVVGKAEECKNIGKE
jgi:hypothetical protein